MSSALFTPFPLRNLTLQNRVVVSPMCPGAGSLDDPRWAWQAADALGGTASYPPQYERSRAKFWPCAKLKHPGA